MENKDIVYDKIVDKFIEELERGEGKNGEVSVQDR